MEHTKNLVPHKCMHCQRLVINLQNTDMDWSNEYGLRTTFLDCTWEQLNAGAADDCPMMNWILSQKSFMAVNEKITHHTPGDLKLRVLSEGPDYDIRWIYGFELWDNASGRQLPGSTKPPSTGFGTYARNGW
jgi:hypothetical protein